MIEIQTPVGHPSGRQDCLKKKQSGKEIVARWKRIQTSDTKSRENKSREKNIVYTGVG